jgi:hypothetical protein
MSVQSELNISRGDNSPCTNNDTVFSTLPAILEAVHLSSNIAGIVEKTVSLFVQGE